MAAPLPSSSSTKRHSLYEEKLHFLFGVGVREHVLLSTELSLDDAEARLLLYLRL